MSSFSVVCLESRIHCLKEYKESCASNVKISFRHIFKTYTRTRIKSRKCEDANIILKSLTAGQNTSSFSFSCSSLSWFSFLLSYFSLCSRVSQRHSSISVPVLRSSSVSCAPILMIHPQFCIFFPLPVICNFAFFGFGTFDLIGHQLIKNSLFLYNLPLCVSQPLSSTPRVTDNLFSPSTARTRL